jgi:hypothetical protein
LSTPAIRQNPFTVLCIAKQAQAKLDIDTASKKHREKHDDTDFLCDGDCRFGLGGRCRDFASRADRAASRRRRGGSQQCDAGSLASPVLARPLGPLALSIGVVVASVG